ncbi:hypothetical protein Dform_01350 [Dehalogenimonas formicexedens]|uniref:Uncharacterized protein n=1 Tax=Dehalogenimonas formicexedens TaxID=1839801 RepID=A0A1P8F870_9CHLR|nr:hypothetical protein Dform_01350 [Dehalogenimonas formicexedens]
MVRLILIAVVLSLTAIVLAAVANVINIQPIKPAMLAIAAIGTIAVFMALRETVRRYLSIVRAFMTVLLSIILIAFSWSYLKIESVQDLKNRIENLFNSNNSLQETLDLTLGKLNFSFDTSNGGADSTSQPPGSKFTKEYVTIDGGRLIGADGHSVTLWNNPQAVDPSWSQLLLFLQSDATDARSYDFASYVCADFAETLHNNAEAAGIKAAYVCIDLGPSPGYPSGAGHALNAFQTTDRGLVFIDDTGLTSGGPSNADKSVIVRVGSSYIPESLFPESGWSSQWESMGTVLKIDIIKW